MRCQREHEFDNINIELCLLSACHVQDTLPNVLYVQTSFLQQLLEGGIIIILILQERTLKHREVKELAQGHRASKRHAH